MFSNKAILTTGSHSSGSTWVGKVLAESPSVRYINEPFNIEHSPCKCGVKFDYWFTYIADGNELIFYKHLKPTIGYSFNLIGEVKTIRYQKDILRIFKKYSYFIINHVCRLRPLIKYPIALFSTEWLASKFDLDVIVLIRHPFCKQS